MQGRSVRTLFRILDNFYEREGRPIVTSARQFELGPGRSSASSPGLDRNQRVGFDSSLSPSQFSENFPKDRLEIENVNARRKRGGRYSGDGIF